MKFSVGSGAANIDAQGLRAIRLAKRAKETGAPEGAPLLVT
jgi:hypothetical protein